MLLFVGCSTARISGSAERAPAWVEGIRNGDESLKVVNGSRVFYRRIIKRSNESTDSNCERALKAAQADLKNESVEGINLPFTLEYLYYDQKHEDCSVTISVGQDLLNRVREIKELNNNHKKELALIQSKYESEINDKKNLEKEYKKLEQFILSNRHLLEKVTYLNSQAEQVRRSIASSRDKARDFFMTGMSREQFRRLLGEAPNIAMHGVSLCYQHFNTFRSSPHGNVHICWAGNYGREVVAGLCDIRKSECFTRDP